MLPKDAVGFPDPKPNPPNNLDRDTAIRIFEALDDQGLPCALETESGGYVVRATTDGLPVEKVSGAIKVVEGIVFDDEAAAHFERGYLTVR